MLCVKIKLKQNYIKKIYLKLLRTFFVVVNPVTKILLPNLKINILNQLGKFSNVSKI